MTFMLIHFSTWYDDIDVGIFYLFKGFLKLFSQFIKESDIEYVLILRFFFKFRPN